MENFIFYEVAVERFKIHKIIHMKNCGLMKTQQHDHVQTISVLT